MVNKCSLNCNGGNAVVLTPSITIHLVDLQVFLLQFLNHTNSNLICNTSQIPNNLFCKLLLIV